MSARAPTTTSLPTTPKVSSSRSTPSNASEQRPPLASHFREPGWNGVTLGINVENADAVDEAFTVAQAAGAHSIASPVRREWGGYSAYVVDPEGNRWEIAWASTSREADGPFAPADGVLVGAPQAFYARLELDDGPVEAQPEVCSCRRSD